jgi:hypothetical protein
MEKAETTLFSIDDFRFAIFSYFYLPLWLLEKTKPIYLAPRFIWGLKTNLQNKANLFVRGGACCVLRFPTASLRTAKGNLQNKANLYPV